MVSVIIPVFNTEKYLARCLDSVLAQTMRDIEVICVDDGSTDSSAAILRDYAAKDSRIRIISQDNAGQGAARNAGLDAMKGDHFTFVDSDDAIHPLYIEAMLAALERANVAIVANDKFAILGSPSKGSTPHPKPPNANCRLQTANFHQFVRDRKIFSSVWNKMYRTSQLGRLRFKSHLFEDWPYLVKAFACENRYAKISAPLYYYNRENVSTIRSPFGKNKIDGYLAGILDVTTEFNKCPCARDVRRRAAVAAKMLMSKARKCSPALRSRAALGIEEFIHDELLYRSDLDLKTRWRLWKIMNYE